MQSYDRNLLAAYRRRAFLTPGLLTVLAAGMALAPPAATGQNQNTPDPPKPTVQTPPVPGAAQTGGAQAGGAPAGRPQSGDPTTIIPRRRRGARGDSNFTFTPDGGITRGAAPGGFSGGTPFSFDFRGADISNVLKLYAQMSGQTITADSTLSGQVTIINPKPVQLDEAFKILQSVLGARGFTALQTGSVISILPIGGAAKATTLLNPDKDGGRIDPRNQVMTQIIPLDNVDANALAKDLQPLISTGASLIGSSGSNALILTDTATNVERFLAIVDSLDKTSANTEIVIYPLRRAEAANVASVINDLYKQLNSRTPTAPAAPGQPQPNAQQAGASGAARPSVVAEADTRTNSVIVVASRDKQTEIAKKLIATLDDDDTNTLDTRFIKIKYADAATIADLVNGVLSNMHGTPANSGSGGSSFQSRAFGFNPFGFGGGGGGNSAGNTTSTDPFGKVVADPRTNSLLVTANAEKMAKIEELVKQMDVAVPTETTTFVIPLKNAQASDVSAALSQAFGTTQNNNNPFAGFFGNNNNNNRNTSTNNGTSRTQIQRGFGSSSTPGGRSAAPAPPPGPQSGVSGSQDDGSAIPQGIEGVMTSNGFVPTANSAPAQTPPTRQFFGGFGGFGGRRQGLGQSNSPQFGRGSNGSYVNLLQLQNNVFATATPNGDSIIVTTTPDNIEAVKAIVEQLDIIPRQVMIEVVVAEVTLDSNQKLGFSASGMLNRLFHSATTGNVQNNQSVSGFNTGSSGTALDAAAAGFQFVLNNANYSAVLEAIDNNNKVKILATPKVFTSNNQQATINIQQFIPYITGQTTTGLSTAVSNQVQYLQVGFSLDVTPRITRQGQVTINLTQEASELLRYQTLGTGQGAITAPVTNDRYTDTSVTVQDNETVVIGGLIRQSENIDHVKVPLLGDIPLIGQLFRSKERSHEKQELVIFLTPHVVSSTEEARAMTRKQGQSIINQLPELPKEQPNLDYKKKSVVPNTVVPTPVSPERPGDPSGTQATPDKPVDPIGSQNPNIKH